MATMYNGSQNLNQGFNPSYFDPEAQDVVEDNKYAAQIRLGFIRKVYGILASQLILTTAVAAVFTINETASAWVRAHYAVTIVAGVIAIVLMLVLGCFQSVAQSFPQNYILLALFTACESLFVGGICAQTAETSGGEIVFQAALATAIIVTVLTLFSCQTKYDFTSSIGILCYISTACCIFAFFTFFFRTGWVIALSCGVMSLVVCAHIVIDTQMLLGEGKVRASEDDYVLCAMLLYIDIVNLFIYLLRILEIMNRR